MKFANPEVFFLFLLIPFYLVFFLKKQRKNALPLPSLVVIKNLKSGVKSVIYYLILPIRLLIIILFIFALARPQEGFEKIESEVKGVDIILAVDTSKSMLAEDLQPQNRIQAAKEVLINFIERQQGNRLGLIVFSGRSFTLSPLTLDYDLLKQLLADIDTETVEVDGTAIGDSLANALYRFDYGSKRNRVVILLTDGENNSGKINPPKATEMAQLKNVKVYTIGVGKPEGAPVPIINPYSGEREYAVDLQGNVLISKVNENELKEIAKNTGGSYFRASDRKMLESVYQEIDQLEKVALVSKIFVSYQEKMAIFLLPAIFLLICEFILNKKIIRKSTI